MSVKVIEFNDTACKVGDASGILLRSPGFALALDKTLQLGELAEQQARLQPTNSYNKFWHELSLDPLSRGDGVRHHADLAYAHLLHLAEQAGIDGEVIFAVPGNFTRQQLAILLGLAKQCPFTPIGVVDSALAATLSAAQQQTLIYVDLQLHQVLLTKLRVSDGQLKTESVIQVPGVGSQNFMEVMMQFATTAFIQQSRFNPQHNAEIEQQLYNALPHWWLQNGLSESSLVLELRAQNMVHTAKIPRESLVAVLSGHYQRINQQIAALASDGDTQVLVSAAIAALPGCAGLLGASRDLTTVATDSVNRSCLQHYEHIVGDGEGLHLVNALPVSGVGAPAPGLQPAAADAAEQPTHILFQHRAHVLGALRIENNMAINGKAPTAHTIQTAFPGLPQQLGAISVNPEGVFLDSGRQEFFLNKVRVSGRHQLHLGDCIQFTPDSEALALIRVNHT